MRHLGFQSESDCKSAILCCRPRRRASSQWSVGGSCKVIPEKAIRRLGIKNIASDGVLGRDSLLVLVLLQHLHHVLVEYLVVLVAHLGIEGR